MLQSLSKTPQNQSYPKRLFSVVNPILSGIFNIFWEDHQLKRPTYVEIVFFIPENLLKGFEYDSYPMHVQDNPCLLFYVLHY